MSEIFIYLRAVNAVLALLTFGGGFYRFPQAWAAVSSRRLFVVLALFPPLAGIGSGRAYMLAAPPNPLTPVFTVAYLLLGWVLWRWPSELDHQESRP